MKPRKLGNALSVFGPQVDELYAHADSGLAVSYAAFNFYGAAVWKSEGEFEHGARRKRSHRVNKNAGLAYVRDSCLRSNARAFILDLEQELRAARLPLIFGLHAMFHCAQYKTKGGGGQ